MKCVFSGLLLLGLASVCSAQVGGGAAAFGGNADNAQSPAQVESSKRQPTAAELKDDNTATFIEASVLMNVKADQYVAVFAVQEEGKTPAEANAKIDATISSFKDALKPLAIQQENLYVDFVAQNRIYAFRIEESLAKEELVGFEIKKNVSIHFKDKLLIDGLVAAAARAQIFDLIKVDYIVNDAAAIQARLQAQTASLIKSKAERYQNLLGVKLPAPTQVLLDKPSIYYPVEQYNSYRAAESESVSMPYDRSRFTVQSARKSRTTYFNPLSGDGFDIVINPIIIEPVVQFTTYLKVRYETGKRK